MSFDPRSLAYPLEALHKREGWRLDAVEASLAAASRRLRESQQQKSELQDEHRAIAATAAPSLAAVIDPAVAATRLAYLNDVLRKVRTTTETIEAQAQAQARLQAERGVQQTRLEAMQRHRADYLRERSESGERRQRAEADSDWLARLHWKQRFAAEGLAMIASGLRETVGADPSVASGRSQA